MPPVTGDAAASDRVWFAANPRRRYRLRKAPDGWWVIRRRLGGVLLRTYAVTIPSGIEQNPDEKSLRWLWVETALVGLTSVEREALLKQIRQGERLNEI
jgi:hypothetical protein